MPKGFGPLKTNVTATVKFFNQAKGFGFVQPEDGSADAFLHAAVLQQSGHAALNPGDVVLCDLMQGPKGPQVASLYEVRPGAAPARGFDRPRSFDRPRGHDRSFGGHERSFDQPPRRSFGYDDHGPAAAPAGPVDGTVKWFDQGKGFGFITPDQGGKDVFVHIRAVEQSGLATLSENQRVRVTTRMGQKGLQADRVELL